MKLEICSNWFRIIIKNVFHITNEVKREAIYNKKKISNILLSHHRIFYSKTRSFYTIAEYYLHSFIKSWSKYNTVSWPSCPPLSSGTSDLGKMEGSNQRWPFWRYFDSFAVMCQLLPFYSLKPFSVISWLAELQTNRQVFREIQVLSLTFQLGSLLSYIISFWLSLPIWKENGNNDN